ncbi:MAG: hypothetical protein KDA31_10730 [Phycisphaerales bacterium]|nr:hypothetical protein [Phycisphaerales bacterium]MCB9835365.1 hypothetical protein [Phycisphaera sp.]
MTPQGYIALLGWFFVGVPALFLFLPKRTAAFSGLVIGWLFLPWGHFQVGPLDITRNVAVSLNVVLCIAVFDPMRFVRLRPSWFDLPIVVWCISPFFTSISNDLGAYDGGAVVQSQLYIWGLPYLIGRVYVTDLASIRHLAMVFIFAAILYVPFILWEIRFSPRLHEAIYGFKTYDHGGTATRRFGGWRPLVFQRHGLMLGVLMASSTLLACWLWFTKSVRVFPLMPPGMRGRQVVQDPESGRARVIDAVGPTMVFWPIVVGLLGIFVLCRALNGLLVFALACGALGVMRVLKLRIPLVGFALIPFLFAGARIAQQYTTLNFDEPMVEAVAKLDEDRAGSIAFRFENEQMLTEKALERPMLGWGGWGRNRVYDDDDNDLTVTDGYWVITLGQNGFVGLIASFLTLLVPVFLLLKRHDAETLFSPQYAAASGLAAVLCMYAVDCLPNSMLNPMYVMAAGGLIGLLVNEKSMKRTRALQGSYSRDLRARAVRGHSLAPAKPGNS